MYWKKLIKPTLIIVLMCIYFYKIPRIVMAGCSYVMECVPGGPGFCGGCSIPSDCHGCPCVDYGEAGGQDLWCAPVTSCFYGACSGPLYTCDSGDTPSECGGACFTSDSQISTPSGQKSIKDLQVGESVKSFNPETGEKTTSVVDKIYEVTRSAYYKIITQDGTELEVTGEHPLYAIQKEEKSLGFWEYLKTDSLTKKLIDWIIKSY